MSGSQDPLAGIDLAAFNAQTAQNESGGQNLGYHNLARSTASGLYGITDTTWQGLMQNYPGLGLTMAGKSDPEQQLRAKNALSAESARGLQAAGLPVTQQNLAMVAFLGPASAKAVLTAPSGASAYDTIRGAIGQAKADQFVQSNPEILHSGATVGDLQALAQKTFGGGQGPSQGQTLASDWQAPGAFNPLLPAGTPSKPPAPAPMASPDPNPLMGNPSQYLSLLAPTHTAIQVDYNPWALQPKIA